MVAFQFGAVLAVGLLAISRPRTRAIYPATGDDALSMFPAARPRSRSRRACVCVCLSLALREPPGRSACRDARVCEDALVARIALRVGGARVR